MRRLLVALGATAFVMGIVGTAEAASPAKQASVAKSKMGCIIGKEKWNAIDGKCVAAVPVKKPAGKAAAKPAQPAAAAPKKS
jgi:hypothetical protein